MQFYFNSGAANINNMATPTVSEIPLGYRPPPLEGFDCLEFFVGLSGNGKACTLKIYWDGHMQVNMAQPAPVQYGTIWVTKDPYPFV